jgi:hypothetical protein
VAIYDDGGPPAGVPPTANVVLLVHHPHTTYLLATAVKAAHRDYLQQVRQGHRALVHGPSALTALRRRQALLRVFACDAVEETELKARDPSALGALVRNPMGQGPASHYRLNEVDPNPLDRKRRRRDEDEDEDDKHEGLLSPSADAGPSAEPARSVVVAEDKEATRARDRDVRALFGTHPLPALDAVRLDVRWVSACVCPSRVMG